LTQVYDPTGTFSFSVSIFYFYFWVGRRCSWVSHHNKYSQSYITTRKKKKKKKREEEEEEEKKRTLKGVVLTSFDSFSISDS
jgi:hypothetical protein